VVLFHWGAERSDTPSRNQRRLAYAAADAGADLVVGHHPHVLQGIEVRGNCLIAYSLGNFVFPSRSTSTRQTMILSYTPGTRGRAQAQVIPCVIEGFAPRPAVGKERRAMLARMRELCAGLGTSLAADGSLALPGRTRIDNPPTARLEYPRAPLPSLRSTE
jgi:poly-gamma-glutamate capsule biosynthesis protein CapA/YwtB (metallophosphatase superfamily)